MVVNLQIFLEIYFLHIDFQDQNFYRSFVAAYKNT